MMENTEVILILIKASRDTNSGALSWEKLSTFCNFLYDILAAQLRRLEGLPFVQNRAWHCFTGFNGYFLLLYFLVKKTSWFCLSLNKVFCFNFGECRHAV